MRDEHDRAAGAVQVVETLHDLGARHGVEVAGGLVGKDEGRPHDGEELPLADGQVDAAQGLDADLAKLVGTPDAAQVDERRAGRLGRESRTRDCYGPRRGRGRWDGTDHGTFTLVTGPGPPL